MVISRSAERQPLTSEQRNAFLAAFARLVDGHVRFGSRETGLATAAAPT
jgi:hypothetical protein